MKLSRRELLAAGAASVATARRGHGTPSETPALPVPVQGRPGLAAPRNLTIRDYLSTEARRITERALSDVTAPAEFEQRITARRRRFLEMMGLDLTPAKDRPPVPFEVTGVVERPGYRIEKLHYESLPDLHVTANLYLPVSATTEAPAPGVLYVCGHAANPKVHYQAHPKRLAELGFATLIAETVQLGEVEGYHHGCYREGWFHWYSRGYSPAAIELLNGIRGLDLLAARREVNDGRLGVTGISGGGATTWWVAAADERVTACAPVCGTATLESYVYDRVVDGHCDCMWWVNTGMWDLADVGALIAPRPLLIASANQDGIFPIHAIRRVHEQLRGLYDTLGASSHLRFVETPGGHSYHARSRTAIFSWFLQHLMARPAAPAEIGDIELDAAKLETRETLEVYTAGAPARNRTATIQDELVKLASPPDVASPGDVDRERAALIGRLRAETFAHFPARPPDLDVKEEFVRDGGSGSRFAFTSEEGWRLHGVKLTPRGMQGRAATLVTLRSPGEERGESEGFADRLEAATVNVIVAPRGTGETAWGEELNWHVRRASAWIGRTIASMQVWDTLRALEAARRLPDVDGSQLSLAARGDMAAVALYAALLDGRLKTLYLESPPATQDAPGQKNGRGPAIEMLSCLRYTDLAQVAGLLYPVEIVVSGELPPTYGWAENLYRQLGPPGRFRRLDPPASGQ